MKSPTRTFTQAGRTARRLTVVVLRAEPMIVRRILAGSIVAACLVAQAETVNPKIVARYKEMLAARPTESTALDRLWKIYLDENRTNELIDEYKAGGTFASEMVLGHLLRKAARPAEARGKLIARAAILDPKSPLPRLALARLERTERRHADAAKAFAESRRLLPEEGRAKERDTFRARHGVAGGRRATQAR